MGGRDVQKPCPIPYAIIAKCHNLWLDDYCAAKEKENTQLENRAQSTGRQLAEIDTWLTKE